MNEHLDPDPLSVDEEPWTVEPEPDDREWSRWGVVVAVAAMCLIVAYHLARGR